MDSNAASILLLFAVLVLGGIVGFTSIVLERRPARRDAPCVADLERLATELEHVAIELRREAQRAPRTRS